MAAAQNFTLSLRPAVFADRRKVYNWLAASEASPWIIGPPHFPNYPVPTWEQFCTDYPEHFFLPEGDGYGRMFMISREGHEIGYISYFGLNNWNGFAELDICLTVSNDYEQELSSRALRQLADDLFAQPSVEGLTVRPSRRNMRAIAACQKAGFARYLSQVHKLPRWRSSAGLDYYDAVTLLRLRPTLSVSN